ncbi:MAG: NAD(+) kinase [Gammaproteobacteria bacterium]|nr:NAD(+) kinase [Gammaproteobacteria bacterium]MDH4254749.1 NAD(+) kinase [Gammaproteobacteria bacterium]
MFKTIAIVGRNDDPRVAEPMSLLAEHMSAAGVDVIAVRDIAAELPARQVSEKTISRHAELIIAVGGDGTMLYAAGLAQSQGVPLLGVNRGRLGFLADITPNEMLDSVGQVLQGHYTQESRLLVSARILRGTSTLSAAIALNDVVVQRKETGRMLDLRTSIAGRYVNTHSGDGLIVATPTGSTAYALSCGGPIIDPSLDALVIVPVCPHTLSDRPIVIPAGHEVEVALLPRADIKAEVAVDGRSIGELTAEDRLFICKAENRITLIHPPGYDFYEILRTKLHWGRDSRFRAGLPDPDKDR